MFSKIIISAICFIFISIPLISFAQGRVASNPGASGVTAESYEPITPGGTGFFGEGSGLSLSGMLEWIFKTSITVTILLSVLMLIIGGIQYMGESISGKGVGKQRIQAALGGLLIALTSILLLSTIWSGGGKGLNFNIFPEGGDINDGVDGGGNQHDNAV